MPRVHHIRRAAKDNRVVKKGESYYWWKFRYGGKHLSATYPRNSELTQSKLSEIYAAQEDVEDEAAAKDVTLEDMVSVAESLVEKAQEVASEYEEADESFGGHQGLNYERAEGCTAYADEVESVVSTYQGMDSFGKNEEHETEEAAIEAFLDDLNGVDLETY